MVLGKMVLGKEKEGGKFVIEKVYSIYTPDVLIINNSSLIYH